MPLQEFASNIISANNYSSSENLLIYDLKLKVLGMIRDYNNEVLVVEEPVVEVKDISKRTLLPNIPRIFDPVGIVNLITIQGKLLVQEVMEFNYNWDAKLPSAFEDKWIDLVNQLKETLVMPVPC